MFRYECWECNKWHATSLSGAISGLREGIARFGLAIGKKTLPLQPRSYSPLYGNFRGDRNK